MQWYPSLQCMKGRRELLYLLRESICFTHSRTHTCTLTLTHTHTLSLSYSHNSISLSKGIGQPRMEGLRFAFGCGPCTCLQTAMSPTREQDNDMHSTCTHAQHAHMHSKHTCTASMQTSVSSSLLPPPQHPCAVSPVVEWDVVVEQGGKKAIVDTTGRVKLLLVLCRHRPQKEEHEKVQQRR